MTVLVIVASAGCTPTQQEIGSAINAMNKAFQADYEAMLANKGVRSYKVRSMDAFVALHAAMGKLGMGIVDQDAELGTLNASAPAPRPLNAQEWQQAAAVDLPRIRQIARPYIGAVAAETIKFEPQGLDIVINATLLRVDDATEISLTARMRQVAPPPSNLPRREYPPPTAVNMALDKIWLQFEQELRLARKIP
jgi:hypothetical protein